MDKIVKHFLDMDDDQLFKCIAHHSFGYYAGMNFDVQRPYFKLQLNDGEYILTILLKVIIPELNDINLDELELIMKCEGLACVTVTITPKNNPNTFELLQRIKSIQRGRFKVRGISSKIINQLI